MNELWITLPDDFEIRFKKYQEGLDGASAPVKGELSYYKKSSILSFGGRSLQIPIASNQSILCDFLFDRPHGDWLEDIEIRRSYFKESETSLYDAVRAINLAVKKTLGIDKLLQYKAMRVRIRIEVLTQNHSDL